MPMPLTRRLIEIIQDIEEGRRRMDWANLDPLVALAARPDRSPNVNRGGPFPMSRLAFHALLALAVVGPAWLGHVPTAEAQKRGGTLTIVRPTDPVSLDPNLETTAPGAWVYFNMLEGLLTLDDKMQVKPSLATGYEVLSPTKVRFKLRPNVKFHDGTPFNAAAVKFTFDRALKGNPPARWASLAGSLAGAEVVDDLTVDMVTKEPYGPSCARSPCTAWASSPPPPSRSWARASAARPSAPDRSSSWSGRPTRT